MGGTNSIMSKYDDFNYSIKEMLDLVQNVFKSKEDLSSMNTNDIYEELKKQIEEESKTKIRVAFFGQPGAGKSSLMNKLAGKKLADAGIKPGMKVTKHVWGENDSIEFIDLPGFDGVPDEHVREEYWENYDCENIDLFLCCFESKFNQADAEFFQRVISKKKGYIFVRTKADSIFDEDMSLEELKKEIVSEQVTPIFGEKVKVVFTSIRTNEGLDELQNEIIQLLDETKQGKWFRNAKAFSKEFLESKKKECNKKVIISAILSACSGAIPLPGIGVPIDMSIYNNLLKDIRICYGLTDKRLEQLYENHQNDQKFKDNIKQLIDYAGKGGSILLLKRYSNRVIIKQIAKSLPIILGSSSGFALTYFSGMKFVDENHEIAEQILKDEIPLKKNVYA